MADFLNELADWIADADRADLERDAVPFELFVHSAEETDIDGTRNYAEPYAVLRSYGGDVQGNDPLRNMSVQVYAVGTVAYDVMTLLEKLYDALLQQRETGGDGDDGDTPIVGVGLPNWFILAVANLRPPGLIGRDVRQRAEGVFNFDVVYRAA